MRCIHLETFLEAEKIPQYSPKISFLSNEVDFAFFCVSYNFEAKLPQILWRCEIGTCGRRTYPVLM